METTQGEKVGVLESQIVLLTELSRALFASYVQMKKCVLYEQTVISI